MGIYSVLYLHSKLRTCLRVCETHISPVNYSTDAEDDSSHWHLPHWLISAALFWAGDIRLKSMNMTWWTLGMESPFLLLLFSVSSYSYCLSSPSYCIFLCFFFLASLLESIWFLRVIGCQLWKTGQQCRPFNWWLSKLSGCCLAETKPHQPHTRIRTVKALCWGPELERERGRGSGSVPEN